MPKIEPYTEIELEFNPYAPEPQMSTLYTKSQLESIWNVYTKDIDVSEWGRAAVSYCARRKIYGTEHAYSEYMKPFAVNFDTPKKAWTPLANWSCCFTGTLSIKRSDAEYLVKLAGGTVHSTPAKETYRLVIGKSPGSTKVSAALKYQCMTFSEKEFIGLLKSVNKEIQGQGGSALLFQNLLKKYETEAILAGVYEPYTPSFDKPIPPKPTPTMYSSDTGAVKAIQNKKEETPKPKPKAPAQSAWKPPERLVRRFIRTTDDEE